LGGGGLQAIVSARSLWFGAGFSRRKAIGRMLNRAKAASSKGEIHPWMNMSSGEQLGC
jgi:hypothetical protein